MVQEKKGRKVFSRGVWAPAATIDRIRAELEAERSTESYARRKGADARSREKAQAEYVEDFFGAVVEFLAFHPNHAELADRLARAVTDHATPVGSGTVALTKRLTPSPGDPPDSIRLLLIANHGSLGRIRRVTRRDSPYTARAW